MKKVSVILLTAFILNIALCFDFSSAYKAEMINGNDGSYSDGVLYEQDFEKEDIIERFSRGDKARTSEGNGLGLAIVSTYAKALGGEFDIKIDCDQFKAIVSI